MTAIVQPVSLEGLALAAAMYCGLLALLFVVAKVLPGQRRQGFAQPNGEVKTYKLSGLLSFGLVTAAVLALPLVGLSLTPILEHFASLFVVVNAVAVVWSAWLFANGRRSGRSEEGHGPGLGGVVRDLWFGPTRNPTLLGVDLKMFAYQPSLIGLWLVIAAFAFRQFEAHGTLTPQMVLFQVFWWAYLLTHYVREDFMLSTWDIIAENFGFMLVWGDLVYVTFLYSLGGWFLMDWLEPMPPWALVALVVLHAGGHWIFRGANWQKDRYKRDPKASIWGRQAEALEGRLLVSGWWGLGRKINYSGEILVYWSFALCTGLRSPIPYLLPVSLMVLLFHRALRDERKCRSKYGELWLAYCRRARFRIVPYLF